MLGSEASLFPVQDSALYSTVSELSAVHEMRDQTNPDATIE